MIRYSLKTGVLLFTFILGFALIGTAIGGLAGFLIASLLSFGVGLLLFFASTKILLKILRAELVGPCEHRNLFGRVQVLSRRIGLRVPDVYVMPVDRLNALACGRGPHSGVIIVSEGCVKALNEEELDGILAHLLARIQSGSVLPATIGSVMSYFVLKFVLSPPPYSSSEKKVGSYARKRSLVSFFIAAPLAAALVRFVTERLRDFQADERGVTVVGSTKGLIAALQKLERSAKEDPLSVSEALWHLFVIPPSGEELSVTRLFVTHPSTESRIEKLSQIELSWVPA